MADFSKNLPKLTESNYNNWRISITLYLLSENGFKFVETCCSPDQLQATELKAFWNASFTIRSTISDSLRFLVQVPEGDLEGLNPFRMWTKIRQHFAPQTSVRRHAKKMAFFALRIDDLSFEQFIDMIDTEAAEINSICDAISAPITVQARLPPLVITSDKDKEKIEAYKNLEAIRASLSHVTWADLFETPMQGLITDDDKLCVLLEAIKIRSEATYSMITADITGRWNYLSVTTYVRDHLVSGAPDTIFSAVNTCSGCGKRNHTASQCFILHPHLRRKPYQKRGHGNDKKEEKKDEKKGPFGFTMLASLQIDTDLHNSLILDSGATCHMIGSNLSHLVVDVRSTAPSPVTLANGTTITCTQCADVPLTVAQDGAPIDIILHDALLLPTSKYSFISVQKIAAKGFNINFCNDHASISVENSSIKATKKGNLFVLDVITESNFACIPDPEVVQQHRKFGHCGVQQLRRLAAIGAISLPPDTNLSIIKQCSDCTQGKMKEKKKQPQLEKYTVPGDLIQADGSGSTVTTIGGNNSFHTIIDSATSFVSVQLCSSKSMYTNHLWAFINTAENQGKKV